MKGESSKARDATPGPSTRVKRRPCVFSHKFVHTDIDPRVKKAFEEHGKKPNFGDMRRTWKTEHCPLVAPYGECPYRPEDCGIAFLRAAEIASAADRPGALFKVVARRMGAERADNKPSGMGASSRPGDAPRPPRGVVPSADPGDLEDRVPDDTLRRPISRPYRLGDLFGAFDPGSRKGRAEDGGEGPRR